MKKQMEKIISMNLEIMWNKRKKYDIMIGSVLINHRKDALKKMEVR